MATKKKAKKTTKPKRAAKKKTAKAKPTAKKPITKKSAAKKSAAKKASRPVARKSSKRRRAPKQVFERRTSQSGTQSGDLQGLRNVATADSESVDELVDEGNAFEADVIEGVEHADDNEEQEVHTHEVPEDDVPEEYLDQD